MVSFQQLLRSRKFLPMFITQALGALNDNILRNGIITFISYKLVSSPIYASFWSNIATALFMLPTILFSAISGEFSDKFKKSYIIRLIKLSEMLIIVLTSYLLISDDITPLPLMLCIFLMGSHAAMFSPAKYAYLPEYLEADELLPANSLVEGSTFMAIALGAGLGVLASHSAFGIESIVSIMVPISLIGWLSSLMIPTNKAQNPDQVITRNILVSTFKKIDVASHDLQIWLPILGISWFWVIGTVHLTNLTSFVQYSLNYDPSVVMFLNTIFTIGIAFGSAIASKLLKGELTTKYIPLSMIAIAFFGIQLSLNIYPSEHIGNLSAFLLQTKNYILILDLFAIAAFSGIYVVPLYTLLQRNSPLKQCSQIIAASNVISSLFMICTSIVSLFLLSVLRLSVPQLFFLMAITNLGLSMFLFKLLPFRSVKPFIARFFRWFFRVEVQGLEHFQTVNKRLIIIANHVSFLDVLFLALFLPGEYIFAVDTGVAKMRIVRFLRQFADAYEIDPSNPIRIKTISKAIIEGNRCIIFPEGRLTNTGSIMKIYEGTAAIAQLSKADIVPVYLGGLRHNIFSRLKGIFKQRLRTQVSITVFPPIKLKSNPDLSSKENREQQVNQIYEQMTLGQYIGEPRLPLYQSLLLASKNHGSSHIVVEDFSRKKLSYRSLILKSQILGKALYHRTEEESNIGVLLPNTLACVVTLFGLYAYRKVPTLLNYTAGPKNLGNSCITAQLNTVITSRQFISKAELSEELNAIKSNVKQVIFLEDLAKDIGILDKIKGLWRSLTLQRFYQKNPQFVPPIDSPAVVLFTSGSEGAPKGVVLSHRNITANIQQSCAIMDLNPKDIMFNALPMFHAFGFNLGTITPILIGVKTFLYPNPKHYATVVELLYDTRSTLLIGTNSFLSAYLKFSKNYDFSNLRAVFTGGEKLQDDTRKAWLEQRGIKLLEGYGSTECGPVISCNTLMYNQAGSVGKVLPGMETRYNPFPDLEIGGELCIRGENVMLGYILLDNPGKIVPLPNGWYDTGDIVTFNEEGFITIVDRIKRFAKISGEMVSLSAIENEIAICWPEHQHGIVSLPDQKRGEKLVLITDKPDADRKELARKLKAQGVSPLSVPNQIQVMKQLPLLGSGKVDYPKLIAFIKSIPNSTKRFLNRKSKDSE